MGSSLSGKFYNITDNGYRADNLLLGWVNNIFKS
jgi:hypothetical protein